MIRSAPPLKKALPPKTPRSLLARNTTAAVVPAVAEGTTARVPGFGKDHRHDLHVFDTDAGHEARGRHDYRRRGGRALVRAPHGFSERLLMPILTRMSSRVPRPRAARGVLLLAAGLLVGCGGAAASLVSPTRPTSGHVTKAQAIAYAHAVNLHAGDLPGFASIGSETEAPKPGRYALEYSRCVGGVNSARRIATISSPEFSAGSGFYSKIVKSTVEVWPTPAIVAVNNKRSYSSHGKGCLVHFLKMVHRQINRERRGRAQIGPFTITIVPNLLPGVSHSFLTKINETRLLRTGAIRAHIYRDIFGFTTGPAEIELEAIGVGHPIPAPTEKEALRLLSGRATTNAIYLRPTSS
jgi:hypothetical protein